MLDDPNHTDPRFAEMLNDERPLRIRAAEIDWGGVPPDGIPALDDPATVPAARAGRLAGEDVVLGVAFGAFVLWSSSPGWLPA